jgi:hypothetical protein
VSLPPGLQAAWRPAAAVAVRCQQHLAWPRPPGAARAPARLPLPHAAICRGAAPHATGPCARAPAPLPCLQGFRA